MRSQPAALPRPLPARLTSAACRVPARSVDAFLKKEWYDIKAPSMFSVRSAGKTLITRSQGTSEWSTRLARAPRSPVARRPPAR